MIMTHEFIYGAIFFILHMNESQAREILGVDSDASTDEIEDKYQELIKKNHPDQGGSSALFKQIKQAHEILTTDSISNNSTASQSANSQSRQSDRTEEEDTISEETYDNNSISSIELSKLIQNAAGQLVTKNRLRKMEPGISHPQTLTESPLIEYILKQEQPHFTLRFTKATINGETITPDNGGYLLLSDLRILLIFGYESGDELFNIAYPEVTGVNSRSTLLGNSHKFTIETQEGECRVKIDHNHMNESQVSGQEELDLEIKGAEQFIREVVYQTL